MLSFTKKTDYALLALAHLAQAPNQRAVNTREIADLYDLPTELLAKILQKLARAGIITSTAGPTGGYRLAKAAVDVSVRAVIQAVDGTPAIAQCMKSEPSGCEQHDRCTIRLPLERVNARLLQMLDLISLEEISGNGPDEPVAEHAFRGRIVETLELLPRRS